MTTPDRAAALARLELPGARFVVGVDGDALDAQGVAEELGVLAVAGLRFDAVLPASAGHRDVAEALVREAKLPFRLAFARRVAEAAPALGVLLLSEAGGGDAAEAACRHAGVPTARVPLPRVDRPPQADRYRARRVLPLLDAVEDALSSAATHGS